jgi:tetratricopeptide (TPR) repeat protein
VLYAALTCRPPFQAATSAETQRLVIDADPVSLRLLNPQVPRDLAAVCSKCLEKRADRRYASAQDLAEDLERFLQHLPTRARPASVLGKTIRWCRRRPAIAGLVALVGLLLVTVIGVSRLSFVRLAAANAELSDAYTTQVQLTEEKQRLATEKGKEAKRARDAEQTVRRQLEQLRQAAAESRFQEAERASRRGDWRSVLEQLDLARQEGGQEIPRHLLFRVYAHQALSERPAAERVLAMLQSRKDLKTDELAETKLLVGDLALATADNLEAALGSIREAIELGLPEPRAEYAKGLLAEEIAKAREHFQKAVELDPFYEPAQATLLLLLVATGSHAEAELRSAFMELVFPEDPAPHIARALLRALQGDRAGVEFYQEKACQRLNEANRANLKSLLSVVGDLASLAKSVVEGKSPSTARLWVLIARVVTMDASAQQGMGFANLPFMRSAWGRIFTVLSQSMTFRRGAAIAELEAMVQRNPDGILFLLLGELKWQNAPRVDDALRRELYPIYRQAVDADSFFPVYRRRAELRAIYCAAPQCAPGAEGFDAQVRERTEAAIKDFLTHENLTPSELADLADASMRAQMPELGGVIGDYWMRHHPGHPDAAGWGMMAALAARNYVRVIEIFEASPAGERTTIVQSLVAKAREDLQKFVDRLSAPAKPPADQPG